MQRDEGRSGGSHQLHFDTDEVALAAATTTTGTKSKLGSGVGASSRTTQTQSKSKAKAKAKTPPRDIHPIVSLVLYLSGSQQSAPTLVTNQTLEEGSVASEAFLVRPLDNRLLAFDGRLLHGVTPYLPLPLSSSASSTPRITLMLGIWGSGVHVSSASTGSA